MKMFKILCSVVVLLVNSSFGDDNDPTLITLPYGQIKGHVLQTENGNLYYSFQQIPYAAPPINRLRFKEPVAPSRWYGILETIEDTRVCYQLNLPRPVPGVRESEDCLYLNVYVPVNAVGPLPVLVYIHGGGYIYGDGTFQSIGPQFFIDYDVIVVAVNYRLGVLGFLTTVDEVIPGNLGLKDQNFALQWVNQNIALFGGDPEKVTIAGESAGASSVGFQLVSKKSAGLFRGAILQSGTAIGPNPVQQSPRNLAFEVGRALDPSFNSDNSTELLILLQSLLAEDITHVSVTAPEWRPVIEDESYEGAFITGPMHEDIKNGNINQVPIIIGFNSEETVTSLSFGTDSIKAEAVAYDEDLSRLVDGVFNINEEDKVIAGEELRKIYTDGTFEDDIAALVRYTSDSSFSTPAIRHAELQSSYTDVFLYQFSYNGLLGRHTVLGDVPIDIEGLDPNGVGHAEDLWYFWDDGTNSVISEFPARDRLVQSYLLRLWSNFVKYSNPTPTQDTTLQNVIWSKVSPDVLNYLNINSTLSVQTNPKKYQQWKEVIDKYAIPPLIGY